ncbi:MAG TPA: ROK family protein [Ktedonobacterales bacterium]|nr:ROK family protein [Ktedonobacterales bacterium]
MLTSRATRILCMDIGGTTTRIGLCAPDTLGAPPSPPPLNTPSVTSNATPDLTLIASFPTEQAYDAQLTRIADALTLLRTTGYQALTVSDGAVAPSAPTFAGVGAAVGGRVTRDGAAVDAAPNLPDYVGRPLARDLAALCGCPARLAHDTVCGLLGERRFGALIPYERCAYLTVSTGTGAAVYLGKGGAGLALSIEIGHQRLDGNDLPCLCGQIGCLETFTGGRQIALRYGRPIEAITEPEFWATFVEKLALGLVNLAQLTRVEAIAVGGAIALNRPTLLPELQLAVDATLRNATLRLLPVALGERAPLLGAALLTTTPDERVLR